MATSPRHRVEVDRRRAGALLAAGVVSTQGMMPAHAQPRQIETGAEVLARDGYKLLAGRRVGLITNQTGRVGNASLVDALFAAPNVKLTGILAPEHGFRGAVEAGKKVGDEIDAKTRVPVFSLYGAARKPTPQMLADVDCLVFDIQDIGVRFYTYISTMGLAMQAAAAARIPFVVLDRPNPIGGTNVAGFTLEPALRSFVGQYTIPTVHGMTVGELARMIRAEGLLDGLETLALDVVPMNGWRRAMLWSGLERPWIPTSPNIPSFASALLYPGIGVVGELTVNEGRGTPEPFQKFAAPWIDGRRLAARLTALALPGVTFHAETFTPRGVPGAAATPRHEGIELTGVRIRATDPMVLRAHEIGMHALALIVAEAKARSIQPIYGSERMFHAIAGTRRLHAMLERGASGADIIHAWTKDVAAFTQRRAPYLMYA